MLFFWITKNQITNRINPIMPAYAPMLEVTYYAQNYAGIIRQWLAMMTVHNNNIKITRNPQKAQYLLS